MAFHFSPNEFMPGPAPVTLLSVLRILPRPVPIRGAVGRSQKLSGVTTWLTWYTVKGPESMARTLIGPAGAVARRRCSHGTVRLNPRRVDSAV